MGCADQDYVWDEGRKRWHFLEPGFYVICRLSFVSGLYEQLSTLYVRPNPFVTIGRTNYIKDGTIPNPTFSMIGPNPTTLSQTRIQLTKGCNTLNPVNQLLPKGALDTFNFNLANVLVTITGDVEVCLNEQSLGFISRIFGVGVNIVQPATVDTLGKTL